MNEIVNGLVPSALSRPYRYVKLEWNADFAMLTVRMGVRPIQCYSLAAMAELQQVFNDISAHPGLVRHFVMASDVHGVFNFGGDLSLFVLLVRARDLDSLRLYARRCIDLVWWWENAATLGVHTTALVQGDALGGGVFKGGPAGDGLGDRTRKSRAFELGARGAKNGFGRAEALDQAGGAAGSEPRNKPQGDPMKLFLAVQNGCRHRAVTDIDNIMPKD